ncbi:BQ5605_C001g00118 [Microbotryum silenes-dioicae]|uniref:BQ5605_C001g00118 protein n=1 Tax=Microbotryum silenes-dioicae TaxID=796604 RepID=A0A2X0M6C9_9BASI|nr:BQ5605_C001g00118 [Microbotryum silenes-dioicae]
MVPKPFIENDCTPIRNTQPLPHRLIVSNLPAIFGDIAKQTAEASLEHLSMAGIGPNHQPAFFESHKIGYPTGLPDPPQSRYKALNTDYFEIILAGKRSRSSLPVTSSIPQKIHAFLNANPYREWSKVPPRFNPRVHLLTAQFLNRADPSTFATPLLDGDGNLWPPPEDLLRKAVKAHIDKHFEDMLDVPAESCISVTTESSTRHDRTAAIEPLRLKSQRFYHVECLIQFTGKQKQTKKRKKKPFIAETACPFKHSCNEIWTVACFVVRPQCSLDFRPFANGVARHRDEQPGGFPCAIVASVQVVRKEL